MSTDAAILDQPAHPLPPGEAALGEGSPSSNPLTPDSCPLTPSPQSLPPLSAPDQARLSAYTQLHFNPCTLAEREKLPLYEILTWLNAPHIRAHLREIRKTFARSFKDRAELSRHTVIDALEDVIATTEDLVEKRRAATTLLRALNPQRRRPADGFHSTGTPPSDSNSRPAALTSSRPSDSRSAAIQELMSLLDNDGTVNRDRLIDLADKIDLENEKALNAESDEDDDEDDNEYDDDTESDQDSRPADLTPSRPSSFPTTSALRPSAPLPLPHSDSRPADLTPSRPSAPLDPSLHPDHAKLQGPKPDYSPAQVVEKIMRAFHEDHPRFSPGGAATTRNFLSKDSPLYRPTFNAFRHAFSDYSIIDLQASKTYELGETTIDGNTATRKVKTTAKDVGPNQVFLFTLTRAGPDEPWLLHDVKPHNNTS